MKLTIQDFRDALKGQRKTEEAIFYFCHAWHNGPDSDLYRIMIEANFHPRLHLQKQIKDDPEILYAFDVLGRLAERAYGRLAEYPTQPIRFDSIKENDVIIHTSPRTFPCIEAGWPCRVYLWHGGFGVACAEGPSGASFHPLRPDSRGFVVGFRR
jgi:hypothetical protein